MYFRRYQRAREALDVNLIPVMNLFVTLIPFLLLSAAFYHVGVIPASLPSQTDQTSDVAADPRAVTVSLVIRESGISLSAANSSLDPKLLEGLAMTIPRKGRDHDLELLSGALYGIKRQYDRSDTLIVLPGGDVPYEEVVRVLDATRELSAKDAAAGQNAVPLFPVVVLSSMVES